MKRFARQYFLASADDCIPPHGLILEPNSRDEIKVQKLTEAFAKDGFDPSMPALVGYPLDGMIQLLSGTHRHEAARRAGIRLPIHLFLRSKVEAAWGKEEEWANLIADIPISKLECAEVIESKDIPGLDERVDLTRDLVYEKE